MKITQAEFKGKYKGDINNVKSHVALMPSQNILKLPDYSYCPKVELMPKQNKYRNERTEVDGKKFASKKEAKRYTELKILERKEEIHFLKTQAVFRIEVNGQLICKYLADFTYYRDTNLVVEDTKSEITRKNPVFRLKKKLVKAVLGIEILET
jgi:hypothetical protein